MTKTKKSYNNKALRNISLVSITSAIALVLIFYCFETNHIKSRAYEALSEYLYSESNLNGHIVPEVYYVDVDTEKELLFDIEASLIKDYNENIENIEDDTIMYFSDKEASAYYFVSNRNEYTYIVYTDVSFSRELVKTTTKILVAFIIFISGVLLILKRNTVKILDKKDESLKSFFANASHELKTPLMAIKGYADGIKKGIVSNKEACEIIDRETERMSELIGNILEISKMDSGVIIPKMADNDIREILYDSIRIIVPKAEEKNIAINVDLTLPLIKKCDEDMLFSVFSNILTNSVRYAESSIEISSNTDENKLLICISNDGQKLSKEDLEHIFDRFYRGNNGQTGIGMALSLEYVKLHGGTISLDSNDNKTTFVIEFN